MFKGYSLKGVSINGGGGFVNNSLRDFFFFKIFQISNFENFQEEIFNCTVLCNRFVDLWPHLFCNKNLYFVKHAITIQIQTASSLNIVTNFNLPQLFRVQPLRLYKAAPCGAPDFHILSIDDSLLKSLLYETELWTYLYFKKSSSLKLLIGMQPIIGAITHWVSRLESCVY